MLKFREWLALHEEEWGGWGFDGTWTPQHVNTPDQWYNSKYQGKGIRWGERGHIDQIMKKYGKKKPPDDKGKPIQDQVPEDGKDERDKEEDQGVIGNESDPTKHQNSVRKVEKMYGFEPTYKLKNMKK